MSDAAAVPRSDGLAPYVPRLLAARPDTEPGWWQADGTLVYADVSGFTKLTEAVSRKGRIGSEELVATLSDLYTRLLTATADGGDVLRFSGDALLVLYQGEDHAPRALHAAAGMRAALAKAPGMKTDSGTIRWHMSIGVDSGCFTFFAVGARHIDLMVAGAAASQVARLQGAAEADDILMGATARAAVPPAWVGAAKADGWLLDHVDALEPLTPAPASGATLDQFVAEPLRPLLRGGRAEHEHRSAVVGFLGARSVDTVVEEPARGFEVLQQLIVDVQEAANEFGVTVISVDLAEDGCNVMLAAGAPRATEDDAGRMLHTLRQVISPPRDVVLRAGVNRGYVFGGDVGAPHRRTYSVMGDVVNVAARLMGAAAPGTVLAHTDVAAVAPTFATKPADPVRAKGKSQPIPVVLVTDPVVPPQPSTTMTTHGNLVGRDRELAELLPLVERAARQGVVVEITGEAGIGKSRFVEDLLRIGTTGRRRIVVGADPFGTSRAYGVAQVLVRDALGIARDLPARQTGAALSAAVDSLDADLRDWLPLLAMVVGAEVEPTKAVDELAPQFRSLRLREVTAQLLDRALPEPTVVVVEDAHWLDQVSSELLAGLAVDVTDRPWLLLTTRRTGRTWPADVSVHGLALGALDPGFAAQLAGTVADRFGIPRRVVNAAVARADGHPFFLLELLTSLRDLASDAALPDSVHTVAQARLDQLPQDVRRTVRFLSVLGMEFEAPVAEHYLHAAGAGSYSWSAIEEFVAPAGTSTLRFRHDLYRVAAYEGLPFARRRELHGHAGLVLERSSGSADAAHAEPLSRHFHEAREWDRAWRYSLAAAEAARDRAATLDAAAAYERALSAAAHLPDLDVGGVAATAETLGDVYDLAGRYDEADTAYGSAWRAAGPAGRARLLLKRGNLREHRGDYPAALRWYRRGLGEVAAAGGDRAPLEAQLRLAYAGVRYRQGKLRDCAQWAHEVEADALARGDRRALAHAYYLLDAAYTDLGEPAPEEYRRLVLGVFAEVGDLVREGTVLNNLGIDAYYEGDWSAALDFYRRSQAVLERAGDVVGTARAANNIGEVLSDQGHLDDAVALFREAHHEWRWASYPVGVGVAVSNLGRAAGRRGHWEEALTLLEEAHQRFRDIGAQSFVLDVQTRTAEVLALAGRAVEAWDLAGTTLQALEAIGADGMYRPVLERIRAQALASTGGVTRAREHVAAALQAAERTGAAYDTALTLLVAATFEPSPTGTDEALVILRRLGAEQIAPIYSRPARAAGA